MTKKRLSDLLKEEVQKDADPVAESSESTPTPAEPVAAKSDKPARSATRRTTGRRTAPAAKPSSSTPKATKSTKESKPEKAASEPVEATSPLPEVKAAAKELAAKEPAVKEHAVKESETKESETKAAKAKETEAKIAELEQALQATQARETVLQKQVSGLQEDLSNQQERLFELKDLMEKAKAEAETKTGQLKKVTAELEEAKQTILKMAESPSKPASPKHTPVYGAGADIVERRPLPARSPASSLKRIPEASIQQGSVVQNSMLSNDDIGWVD